MPSFETEHFGSINYEEASVVFFAAGIPGFETEQRFLLLTRPETQTLVFMQSLSRADLCFLALPVQLIDPEYQLHLEDEDLRAIGLPLEEEVRIGSGVLCLALLAIEEDRAPTANLLAPIVVNMTSGRALQAVQPGSGYSHQHRLWAAEVEASCL